MSAYHDRPTARPDTPHDPSQPWHTPVRPDWLYGGPDNPTATPADVDTHAPYRGPFGVRVPSPRNHRGNHPWPAPAAPRTTDPGPLAYALALLLPVLLALAGCAQLLSATSPRRVYQPPVAVPVPADDAADDNDPDNWPVL